jgi:hypothetical protein
MRKTVPTDQQTCLIHNEKESQAKFDMPRRVDDILKVFNRIKNRLSGFIQLTEEEQREAGVYRGLHRYD